MLDIQMVYTAPTNLAVIACPGGEAFANQVVEHLKHIYKHRFNSKTEMLLKRYEITKEALQKEINYHNDLRSSDIAVRGNTEKYRVPNFKVNSQFTFFMNGEFKTEIMDCIRGKDVYIFQDVENHEEITLNGGKNKQVLSVNDHIMSLLVTIDSVRQAGAEQISLVLPAYPYSRQHKKKGRESLTASMLSRMYENLGVSRIITLDIHSREIENSFAIAHIENLHASYQIIRELGKIVDLTGKTDDLVVVAPDTGAVDRNKFYANGLRRPLAMLYKERDYSIVTQNAGDTNIKAIKLLGDVQGKIAFMADDMLGTGGTLLKAMQFLKESGAVKVIAAISLPFFTGNAIEQFDQAYKQGLFYRIIGTNAVHHNNLNTHEWFIPSDVTPLFANVISRIHHNQSLSDLLDNRNIIEKLVKFDTE